MQTAWCCSILAFLLIVAILTLGACQLQLWSSQQCADAIRTVVAQEEPRRAEESIREILRTGEQRTIAYTAILGSSVTLTSIGFYLFLHSFDRHRAQVLTRETERLRQRERTLIKQAECDTLTGFLRTEGMRTRVDEYLSSCPDGEHILIVFDLDDFKSVNDSRGHQAGDSALLAMADCLRASFRQSDLLCRFGGDEFAVFMRGLPSPTPAGEKACEVLHEIHDIEIEGLSLSASAGLAQVGVDGTCFDTLFTAADCALYRAKQAGKGRFFWASCEK